VFTVTTYNFTKTIFDEYFYYFIFLIKNMCLPLLPIILRKQLFMKYEKRRPSTQFCLLFNIKLANELEPSQTQPC